MAEPLDLAGREGLETLSGWGGKYGLEIISNRDFEVVTHVTPLPEGQLWTTANLSKAGKLEAAAKKYEEMGFKNGTLLTLQACALNGKPINILHPDLSAFTGSQPFKESRSGELILGLGQCSYFEHLARMRGDVEGLEDQHALLVSLQCRTKDGKLVFALRKGVSLGENKIGVIGGTYDYGDEITEIPPQPRDIAMGEIREELGLEVPGETGFDPYLGESPELICDQWGRWVITYNVNLPYTSSEVLTSWRESFKGQTEHSELYIIDDTREELLKFAMEHPASDFHPPADALFVRALRSKFYTEKEDIEMNEMAMSA